jgi:hypothetical protein
MIAGAVTLAGVEALTTPVADEVMVAWPAALLEVTMTSRVCPISAAVAV